MRLLAFCVTRVEKRCAELLAGMLAGNAEVVIRGPAGEGGSSGAQGRPRLAGRIARRLYILPLRIVVQLRRARRNVAYAEAVIDETAPDAVVLFEDNVEDVTRFIGATAARRGIPYVVLPTTIPNPREPASVYRHSRAHAVAGLLAGTVAQRWPEWVFDLDGQKLLRLPVPAILALKSVHVDIPTPWILNSGQARAICVESPAMQAIYRRLGFEDTQLALTGSPVDEVLYSVHRERAQRRGDLLNRLGLDPGRPLVLVAFPPNQYAARSAAFEYASFQELLDGWWRAIAPLAGTANVVVRPHPRLRPEDLKGFKSAGCRVVTEPTEQLVPLADVYVASISATIRWALALGIPVINYDCYRYRYDDYQDAAGMLLVEDQHAFAAALQRIATDADYRQALGARQAGDRANWGCIDSQFAVRFLALLKALCGLAIEQPDGTRGGEAAGPALRPQGLVSRP
jgi:hypothetical protein